MMTKAEAAVKSILSQGGDPKQYRLGLAHYAGVAVEVIDAIISAAGQPQQVSDETIARERMAEDRRLAQSHRAAYRAANHEED